MNTVTVRLAIHTRTAATIAALLMGAMSPFQVAAQQLDADRLEQMVDYAQCIRDNGYPQFPDPTSGGFQFRIERNSVENFRAAQQACASKAPSDLLEGRAPGAEQMESLVVFAGCMREQGVTDFPDPSPQGGFDINGPAIELDSPKVRGALETCRKAHPINGLMIRRGG